MIRKLRFVGFAIFAIGCSAEMIEEPMGQVELAAFTTNAFTTNAFTTNAFTTNAFTTNAFTTNAFTTNAFTTNAFTTNALMDPTLDSTGHSYGENTAQVIKYSARCMLRPDQYVDVSYVDSTGATVGPVRFPGNLGLQPNWVNGGLTDNDRLWWAACLGAHVNATGTPTNFSARSDTHTALSSTREERQTYPTQEGAVWATVDMSPEATMPIRIYSCQGAGFNVATSTRYCMGGTSYKECGMFVFMGQCGSSFGAASANCSESRLGNYNNCQNLEGVVSTKVITAFLQ